MIRETAEDLLVWTTIAALVRLNWRLRNVLSYLLIVCDAWLVRRQTYSYLPRLCR